MEQRRGNEIEPGAKVLKFRSLRPRRGRVVTASEVAQIKEARVLQSRRQKIAAWLNEAWMVLAWIVALSLLTPALSHHRVFNIELSMAFVLAISLPMMRGGRIASAVRAALAGLSLRRRARREAKRSRTAQTPPRVPLKSPDHPLQ